LQPSDEEILGYGDEDEDEDEEEDTIGEEYEEDAEYDNMPSGKPKGAEEEDDADLGGWGPSKKDYYDADAIETEQDALDEEAEARRIQQKQLQAMTEADFGFDEDEWAGKDVDTAESGMTVTEVLPQLQITDDMTTEEKKKLLETRYPEFEHISKEFTRLQPIHDELKSAANAAERLIKSRAAKSGKIDGTTLPTPTAVTKYRACASYLGMMAMYFAVLCSTAPEDGSSAVALNPAELHDHPVMESLLKCQQQWAQVESLPLGDPMVETSNGDELSVIEEASDVAETEAHVKEDITHKKKELKKLKKSKSDLATEAAQAEADARRAKKLRKTEEELASLSALTDRTALRKAVKSKTAQQSKLNLLNGDDSDFGEETNLTAQELAEKAKKKKGLRFYTSQIVGKAEKRGAAGRDQGGDADIPHRERLKDRQARLQAQAENRGQNKDAGPGVALGEDGDSDDGADDVRAAVPGDTDDYYDMVASRGKAKKQDKAERAAAYAKAEAENGVVVPKEEIGPDGKRKISYLISKNKGLTPHRKKEVRNPRVKKKLKYEAKKKKLKSMKQVYSGGESRGGYGGELTGIKPGLVRSTKL
jgi:U3 small nucleolar RNA-associated protein 3